MKVAVVALVLALAAVGVVAAPAEAGPGSGTKCVIQEGEPVVDEDLGLGIGAVGQPEIECYY